MFETWPIIASNISQTDIKGNLKEAFLSVNSKVNWGKFVHELNIKNGFLHYSLQYFLSTAQAGSEALSFCNILCFDCITHIKSLLAQWAFSFVKFFVKFPLCFSFKFFKIRFFGGKTEVAKYSVLLVLHQAVNMIILHNKMNYLNTVNLTLFLVLKSLYG